MNTRGRKAKGRRLQTLVAQRLLDSFPELTGDDIRPAIMSEAGADIKLSKKAKEIIGYSIECKNQEVYKKIYDAYTQAKSHYPELEPIVVLKINFKEPLVVMSLTHFINRLKESNIE